MSEHSLSTAYDGARLIVVPYPRRSLPARRRRDRRHVRRWRPDGQRRARVRRRHGRAGLARRLWRSRGQRAHGEDARVAAERAHHPSDTTTRATAHPDSANRSPLSTPSSHHNPSVPLACFSRSLAFTPSAPRAKLSTASSPRTALDAKGTAPTWPRPSAA